jgi:site-specific DNA recombinase
MRAAIYARVSTEDQAKEGFSVPAQLKRLNAYCKARNWLNVSQYVDEGFSGRDVKRPAYQRMMDEKDKWDVLVVLKMDRIHRNSRNFAQMMDSLNAWGKEFNSMQEAFDTTTAIGRFVMDTIQRIAQLESEQIGERVKVGMTQKAKKGAGYLGFGQPFGYLYQDRSLCVIESEAEVVQTIYSLYLGGLSIQDIANHLDANNIKSKKGSVWSKEAISNILHNPLYCGYVSWDGILRKGHHLPIISIDTHNQVQAMMQGRAGSSNGIHSFIRPEGATSYG